MLYGGVAPCSHGFGRCVSGRRDRLNPYLEAVAKAAPVRTTEWGRLLPVAARFGSPGTVGRFPAQSRRSRIGFLGTQRRWVGSPSCGSVHRVAQILPQEIRRSPLLPAEEPIDQGQMFAAPPLGLIAVDSLAGLHSFGQRQ